jgi:bifunctional DNase/RNase
MFFISFVFLGCALNSHIKTIHQMYLSLLEETGSTLESGIVEAKHGDVFYSTLEFRDKNERKFRTIASFSDAIILTALAGTELYILKKVVDEIEDFNGWTYFQEICDNSLDDD